MEYRYGPRGQAIRVLFDPVKRLEQSYDGAPPEGLRRQAVNLRRLYQLMSAEIESVQEVMTNIDRHFSSPPGAERFRL